MSSPKIAGALLEDAGGAWLRRGAYRGMIKLHFDTGETCELHIRSESYGETITNHQSSSGEALWDKIFACGYGAARRSFGDKSYSEYSFRDAVSGLFNYDSRLQNPELMLRRVAAPASDAPDVKISKVLSWIDRVLMLPPKSTRLERSGLEVRGPWGGFTPVGALGDGYKATLAWILDLVGWALYRNFEMLRDGVSGIVLLDEIEQHLHPQWQRRIIGLLHKQFPEIQFISTTHSPLCAIGTTDFENDSDVCLSLLRQTDNCVQIESGLKPPRGLRADQVLTSYLFGLTTTSDDDTKSEIGRLSKLLGIKKPTAAQKKEVEELRKSLNEKLGSGETELERRASKIVDEAINDAFQKKLEKVEGAALAHPMPEQTVELEVKRQFRELLDGL